MAWNNPQDPNSGYQARYGGANLQGGTFGNGQPGTFFGGAGNMASQLAANYRAQPRTPSTYTGPTMFAQ